MGTHPSAAASRVLQRPSGVSMLAAASMPMVAGSKVSSAAVTIALSTSPAASKLNGDGYLNQGADVPQGCPVIRKNADGKAGAQLISSTTHVAWGRVLSKAHRGPGCTLN